jgi:sulfur-oxidizing protein SoxB
MDVDLKLASRVRGLDAILGGHTHDGVPIPVKVKNSGGVTLVTNAGSNGKFLGVLDFDVRGGKVADFRYKLLPVFSKLLAPDLQMSQLITQIRKPFESRLSENLATTDQLLYRRGNFNGSFDQVILDGLMAQKNAEIAFSPGFRWGTSLLPGQAITMEGLMDQTAITYPNTTVSNLSGETIKSILEDVADNLFNPDPYYQQGGDMVRVGGLQYTIDPNESMGKRISEMRLNGSLIDADKNYRIAGWASVSEEARESNSEPIWDLMSRHLKEVKVIRPKKLNEPMIKGVANNPGIESLDT